MEIDELPVIEEDYNIEWDNYTENELKKHNKELSKSYYDNLEKYAGRNWHFFYKSNTTHFYKDRNYLPIEFSEIGEIENPILFEPGCGVGNSIFPLLKAFPTLKIYGCDFAKSAIELLKVLFIIN